MSITFWLLLLVVKFRCIFSLKSLFLGVLILVCRFCIRMLIRIYCLAWYSLIFFIVYIGGLLVLFIYISSLKFKPVFYLSFNSPLLKLLSKLKILFLCVVRLTQITWNLKSFYWGGLDINKFRFGLFNNVEIIFLIKVGIILLVVLWVITKLSFRKRRALRPFYR